MSLADIIVKDIRGRDRLHTEFSLNEGSTLFFLNLMNEKIKLSQPYTIVSTRTLGSSFILGHPGLGWLGYNAASVAVGSQPYLGDSRGAWDTKIIHSPNNTFVETFDGSRFLVL